MYEYLKGIITKITAKYIVLETNGIGYILHVANPYAYSGQVNQETQIYVHQVVREDAHLLYGFRSEDEKKLFLSLISVSGIGLSLIVRVLSLRAAAASLIMFTTCCSDSTF